MRRLVDLTGQRFGRLTVLGRGLNYGTSARWDCLCDCGNKCLVFSSHLSSAKQKSCGCARRERTMTHGLSKTLAKEYKAWSGMMDRCYNPNHKRYSHYGARGILVCDRWHDPVMFVADMGPSPTKDHSIDRIDNDLGYEPGNCRWATRKEQMNNRRVSRRVAHNGETRTVTEWAESRGVQPQLIAQRLDRGWSIQKAIEEPSKRKVA